MEQLDLPLSPSPMFDRGEEPSLAQANRDVIDALLAKPLVEPRVCQTFICRWCMNPTTQVPKSWGEYVQLRAVLMIPDNVADPPICDECYNSAVGSFNRQFTNHGTRNDGHANMVLRQFG